VTDHNDTHLPAVPEEPIANPGLPRTCRGRPTSTRRPRSALSARSRRCSAVDALRGPVRRRVLTPSTSRTSWDTFAGFGASNLFLGLTLGFALLLIGVGVIHWARKLMGDHEISELRHPAASSEEDRAKVLADLAQGLDESGIARRPLVRNTLLGALGFLGVPAVVALTDLGPVATPAAQEDAGEDLLEGRHTASSTT
jgi:ubiquinol-cytochrome c reductase iron-sulfur subunit